MKAVSVKAAETAMNWENDDRTTTSPASSKSTSGPLSRPDSMFLEARKFHLETSATECNPARKWNICGT